LPFIGQADGRDDWTGRLTVGTSGPQGNGQCSPKRTPSQPDYHVIRNASGLRIVTRWRLARTTGKAALRSSRAPA
jgi:hypothetical protein